MYNLGLPQLWPDHGMSCKFFSTYIYCFIKKKQKRNLVKIWFIKQILRCDAKEVNRNIYRKPESEVELLEL